MENIKNIFISHAVEDRNLAASLQYLLTQGNNSISVFVSSDGRSLNGEWYSEIMSALKNADVFIALISDISHQKNWINFEIGYSRAASEFKDTKTFYLGTENLDYSNLKDPIRGIQIKPINFDTLNELINKITKKDMTDEINSFLKSIAEEYRISKELETAILLTEDYFGSSVQEEDINRLIDYYSNNDNNHYLPKEKYKKIIDNISKYKLEKKIKIEFRMMPMYFDGGICRTDYCFGVDISLDVIEKLKKYYLKKYIKD